MKKIFFALSLVIMIFFYTFFVNESLSDSLIRFHVIANSNSDADQQLKLKVRDAVIAEAEVIFKDCKTKVDTVNLLLDNKESLRRAARYAVREQGYDYDVDVEYGNFYFPEKKYENISLPSGKYDAVRVTIGSGNGKNWWCVMFPPLCISENGALEMDEEAAEYLKDSLTKSEYEMLTQSERLPVKIRFKTVDLVMKIIEKVKA